MELSELTALGPKKRSFTIRGHRTSISLEDEFWLCLQELAAAEDLSVAAIVTRIDAERGRVGLSSAIRTYVLQDLRAKVAALHA
ncbi:MAG: ribbon-helix-helix domain-containing protein [Pseudomonadota bacterium]